VHLAISPRSIYFEIYQENPLEVEVGSKDQIGFHCGNVRINGRRCGAAKREGARILPSLDLRAAVPDHLPVSISFRLLKDKR